jgi:hypothetical protein
MAVKSWYDVMVGGKTTRAHPHVIKAVGTKKDAMQVAQTWMGTHPGRVAGIFKVSKVKVFATRKQRVHHRVR